MAARRTISLRIRRFVASRAHFRCEYCLLPEHFSLDTFTIDHIRPLTSSGTDDPDNLAYACHNCNNRKQDAVTATDPESQEKVPLYNPRIDYWNVHFEWSEDALTMVPLTAIGRATLARLHLNRNGAVNIRVALIAMGEEHPAVHRNLYDK